MDRLPSVIGPAPSELPFDQLIEKLQKERKRITTSIAMWRQNGSWERGKPKKTKTKTKKAISKASASALAAAGISPEEFRALLEQEKG